MAQYIARIAVKASSQQLFIVHAISLSEMLLSPELLQSRYLVKLLINNNVGRLAWSLLLGG
jgi:hypothetical protein